MTWGVGAKMGGLSTDHGQVSNPSCAWKSSSTLIHVFYGSYGSCNIKILSTPAYELQKVPYCLSSGLQKHVFRPQRGGAGTGQSINWQEGHNHAWIRE